MDDRRELEENLRTIRRLMERGQVYEAVSARGAVLAGALALATAAVLWWIPDAGDHAFVIAWAAVAFVVASWTLVRAGGDARREGRSSPQARAVAVAVLPAYAVAAVLTVALWRHDAVDLLPPTWMLLHGTAILATWYHAPARLVRLGAAFVVLGAVLVFVPVQRDAAMALGFGGLNLLHGVACLVAGARRRA